MNILFIVFCFFVGFVLYTMVNVYFEEENEKWWLRNSKKNFPFTWKGRVLWYSRAVAVTSFVYGKNADGVWHVLANKRGNGTPDFTGYWNVPCGYLDFNETGENAAIRETFEETGLNFKDKLFRMCGVSTNPNNNRQNVSIRYNLFLKEPIESFSSFSKKYMEKDEVEDIKWIPLTEINNYEWAFGHNAYILSIFEEWKPKH